MTSLLLHRKACFQAAARNSRPAQRVVRLGASIPVPRHVLRAEAKDSSITSDDVQSALTLDPAPLAVEGIAEILDSAAAPVVDSVGALQQQIQNELATDDPILLTEDEAEAYQDFETLTREEIGAIKDEVQLEIGIAEEELLTEEVDGEDVEVDVTSNLTLTDEEDIDEDGLDFDDEDDEAEADAEFDEDMDSEDLSVEKVLDIVDAVQDKYELNEDLQDALELVAAAQTPKVENLEFDESDAFFAEYMPGLEDDIPEYPPPEFKLNFLWMKKNVGISVDQVYAKGERAPLTEYYFWPRKDAWDELRVALEARPWVSERDRVILLNRVTEVINYWQSEDEQHTIEQAREAFTDCSFLGEAGEAAAPSTPVDAAVLSDPSFAEAIAAEAAAAEAALTEAAQA